MKQISAVLACVVVGCMAFPEKSSAGPRDAMEYVPGDTGIYNAGREGGRETRSRIAGSVRVPANFSRKAAMRQAIRAWEQQALKEFGPTFAHWRRAQGKVIRCDEGQSVPYSCAASAIPSR